MLVPNESWIVTDEDGRVYGRLLSPYFSSAVYFAERWWPDFQPVVWRYQDASRHQQVQASELTPIDTVKCHELLMWAERLQEKFERTRVHR